MPFLVFFAYLCARNTFDMAKKWADAGKNTCRFETSLRKNFFYHNDKEENE